MVGAREGVGEGRSAEEEASKDGEEEEEEKEEEGVNTSFQKVISVNFVWVCGGVDGCRACGSVGADVWACVCRGTSV